MHSHTPRDRGGFESPEFDPSPRPSNRDGKAESRRAVERSLVVAALVFAAIVAVLIVL
jgi:hypothetical protein